MTNYLTVKETICKMSEYDLVRNLDKGREYTGFSGLYRVGMMEKRHVFKHGHVYDISNYDDSTHILTFFKKLFEQENEPEVVMTSGSFFSMNKKLQKEVVNCLIEMTHKGSVKLYAGDEKVKKLFTGSDVQVKVFNRNLHFIPHFIKTKHHFNFVMPHTEKKVVRVDINSDTFDSQTAGRILDYFDKLIAELDKAIENNNRTDNNAKIPNYG